MPIPGAIFAFTEEQLHSKSSCGGRPDVLPARSGGLF